MEDILSDLSTLSNGDDNTSTARHPVLSLGHSLAPSDTLSSSERSNQTTATNQSEKTPDDATASLAAHFLATNQIDEGNATDVKSQLLLLQRYLSSVKDISQLNKPSQDAGGSTRIDALYQKIAELQVRLDSIDKGVQGALEQIGSHAG